MSKEEFIEKIKEIKINVPDEEFFINYNNEIYNILDEKEQLEKENQQLKSVNSFSKRKLYKMNKDRLEANLKLVNENKQLKEKINTYEDPEDLTLMFMYCEEKAKDKIKNLNQRIDKAIEYIEGAFEMALYTKSVSLEKENIEELLEILKGGNNGETE